jgi:transcriptional regulator with XRE-family HTH domain
LGAEFAFLDEVPKARASSGLTQAEVAERIGTTQSAVARLESGALKHSPSIATLHKYAKAFGYSVEVKFVKNRGPTSPVKRTGRDKRAHRQAAEGVVTPRC